MSEWISVKEKFPEFEQLVLTEGNSGLVVMERVWNEEGWYWSAAGYWGMSDLREPDEYEEGDYEPTHWMPLPEPPKETV